MAYIFIYNFLNVTFCYSLQRSQETFCPCMTETQDIWHIVDFFMIKWTIIKVSLMNKFPCS